MGSVFLLGVGLGVAALLLWRGLLVVLAAIAVLVVGAYIGDQWLKWRAIRRFRAVWGVQGKDLLLAYSNSPHWQRYVEENWLPQWGHRAVILNWSDRSNWGRPPRPEVQLFRAFAGARDFNPLGIVVPVTGQKAHVVRFWRAFRDHKHGKDRRLRAAEADLDRRLGASGA